jgi:hypothetical protein
LFTEIALDDDCNLVLRVSRILMVHMRDEAVIDAKRLHIDALKLDLVGRMAGVIREQLRASKRSCFN